MHRSSEAARFVLPKPHDCGLGGTIIAHRGILEFRERGLEASDERCWRVAKVCHSRLDRLARDAKS